MKKNAFTLVEVMICLIIVALLAIVMISNLKSKNFKEKSYIGAINKYIALAQETFSKITEDQTACPTGSFMQKVSGTWQVTTYKSDGTSKINATEFMNLFGQHIKFKSGVINFCDNSGWCTDTTVKGAKLPGGAIIGISIGDVQDCREYYMPGETSPRTAPTVYDIATGQRQTEKCFGSFYIDANALDGPNNRGKDVFVIGIGKKGLAF